MKLTVFQSDKGDCLLLTGADGRKMLHKPLSSSYLMRLRISGVFFIILFFFSPLYSINNFTVNLNAVICFFLSVGLRIMVRTFTSSYQ